MTMTSDGRPGTPRPARAGPRWARVAVLLCCGVCVVALVGSEVGGIASLRHAAVAPPPVLRGPPPATRVIVSRDRADTSPLPCRNGAYCAHPFLLVGAHKGASTLLFVELVKSAHVLPSPHQGLAGVAKEIMVAGHRTPQWAFHFPATATSDPRSVVDVRVADDVRAPVDLAAVYEWFMPTVPRDSSALFVDASPMLRRFDAARDIRRIFPDAHRSIRLVATLRHPLDRTVSHYDFYVRKVAEGRTVGGRFGETQQRTLEQALGDELAAIAECQRAFGGDDRDGRDRGRNWYAACLSQDDAIVEKAIGRGYVWNSLYGEQLRHWYCSLLSEPDTRAWSQSKLEGARHEGDANGHGDNGDDDADVNVDDCLPWAMADGQLSARAQSRLMVVSFEQVTLDTHRTVDDVLEFVGAPRLHGTQPGALRDGGGDAPPPAATGPSVNAAQQPHTQLPDGPMRRQLLELLAEDTRHLYALLGRDFGWEL